MTLPNSRTFSVPAGTYTASELNISCRLVPYQPDLHRCRNARQQLHRRTWRGAARPSPSRRRFGAAYDTVTCTFVDTQGQDLTVTKTAAASYSRVYKWLIDKSVDDTRIEIAEGGTATFNYDVKVTPDGYTDCDVAVSGEITVSNPTGTPLPAVDLSDSIDNGGSCSVTNGTNLTVPANDSVNTDLHLHLRDRAPTGHGHEHRDGHLADGGGPAEHECFRYGRRRLLDGDAVRDQQGHHRHRRQDRPSEPGDPGDLELVRR